MYYIFRFEAHAVLHTFYDVQCNFINFLNRQAVKQIFIYHFAIANEILLHTAIWCLSVVEDVEWLVTAVWTRYMSCIVYL